MRLLLIVGLLLGSGLAAASQRGDAWWEHLQALCGKAFEGVSLQAPPGDISFSDQRLLMHVRSCSEDRIRIPYVVGDNLSRTWVLSRKDGRIELKHDHRHPDGTSEDVTNYGGRTPNPGSALSQIFPADDETVAVLPNSYPNVWMISIDPGVSLEYFVQRQATERAYRVRFDLRETVAPPPAPWGWSDD